MNSELRRLIHLQQLDLKIVELQQRAEQIPEEIETLNQILEENRQTLEQARQLIEEDNKQRRLLEGEVETLRERLSKYKSQLMEVRTNKEYQAMLHEIENTEREIEAKEDHILERMMAIDEREEQAREAKGELEKKEEEILEKRGELESFASQAESQIVCLQEDRRRLEEEISEQLTEQYQRIASVRNGVALAEAKDQSCQACHVKLRPQLFADIRTNQQIITCENCNRILYHAGP
ncbi:MAG: zinc ribbon domain-containing protein [Acidobacteriota bacterium]